MTVGPIIKDLWVLVAGTVMRPTHRQFNTSINAGM